MALLKILHFPDARLREVAQPVTEFDSELQSFVEDLFETMYDAKGVGLAATQVGVAKRVAVMDCSEENDEKLVIINPQIVESRDEQLVDEGCLSIPGFTEKVKRFNYVKYKAQDASGEFFELEVEGLMAQAVQHELDHLDGKLYVDYLSKLKRNRIRKKMEKEERLAKA